MGQFATGDFVGTEVKAQRWFDSKSLGGKIERLTLGVLVVTHDPERWMQRGDRFIFHLEGKRTRARLIAHYDRFEAGPPARHYYRVISHLEYQPPRLEPRHPVDGGLVEIEMEEMRSTAFVADVSESGLGILCDRQFPRGAEVFVCGMDGGAVEAEVRYSVKSSLAPAMYRTGLKMREARWKENSLWTSFLRAA